MMAVWRKQPYSGDTMPLWHGTPLRFKESILKQGILPRCDLPVSETRIREVSDRMTQRVEERYGVSPSPSSIAKAMKWAKVRLRETKGCVYTSGNKGYATGNCLGGDEWVHEIVRGVLYGLKDTGSLPVNVNIDSIVREFYPDTECALFKLKVPITEVKAVPENRSLFEVYEGKYTDPEVRNLFAGTDDFYESVFEQVHLPRIDPKHIERVDRVTRRVL